MYLNEDILRIIYGLDEQYDTSEAVVEYWISVYTCALEAISIFEKKFKPENTDFLENEVYLKEELEKEEPDFDEAETFLNELRTDKRYDEILQTYVDNINKNIIEEGLKENPDARDELEEYLNATQDIFVRKYLQLFS